MTQSCVICLKNIFVSFFSENYLCHFKMTQLCVIFLKNLFMSFLFEKICDILFKIFLYHLFYQAKHFYKIVLNTTQQKRLNSLQLLKSN